MDNGLQNSIARVLGGADPEAPAGTAFLFAISHEEQFWMTCHHVVRGLPSLKLAVYANDTLTTIDCEYRPKQSSPAVDVAVLKTKVNRDAVSSLGLRVLPFGDPSASSDYCEWSLIGCGMQEAVRQFPYGIPFAGKFSAPHNGVHESADDDALTNRIQTLGNPWNIPFVARTTKLYEFCDETTRLEPGFSGSPICIAPQSAYQLPMCVGMLKARRVEGGMFTGGRLQGGPKYGYVVPFDVINAACPNTIPFYKYASCVVVVLAAKRDELETLRSKLPEEVLNRLPNYHNTSRDEWHPFMLIEPAVKGLLDGIAEELPALQLASEFLDCDDASFRQYLGGRHLGPLVYVVDPCSTNVEAIHALKDHISDTKRGAHYIYALCSTIGAREQLKHKVKDYLGGEFWQQPHSRRLEPAEDVCAFANRVREAMREACEQFLRENPDEGRRGKSSHSRFDWAGGRR